MLKCIECGGTITTSQEGEIKSYDCDICKRSVTFTGSIEPMVNDGDAI